MTSLALNNWAQVIKDVSPVIKATSVKVAKNHNDTKVF